MTGRARSASTASGGAGMIPGGHVPVMLDEVLAVLEPRDGAIYVDGTFGAGGYSRALLEAADCKVWGIDRDPHAVSGGEAMAAHYAGRLAVIEGRFGAMDRLIGERETDPVDGVALDLGVSSTQLDDPARGFSFRFDGPLDMRMDAAGEAGAAGDTAGLSAADVVNDYAERDLSDIIHRYGEERRARRVARAIVAARRRAPIERTEQLATIVRGAVGRSADGLDPATRTFQALRIYVNDEIGELGRGLCAAERLLAPGGRLAVVSFQSLEDRTVKDFLRERSGAAPRTSRHQPDAGPAGPDPTFELIFKAARRPSAAEQTGNPRARSARLRAARRTAAPAWTGDATRGAA